MPKCWLDSAVFGNCYVAHLSVGVSFARDCTEKVTQQRPTAVQRSQAGAEYGDIVGQAERSILCSTDKIDFPETSAQEVTHNTSPWMERKA